MNNEKGSALLVVLLIIVMTAIFAVSLSGMAISSRLQYNKTDQISTATDLAEMGITHYQSIVDDSIQRTTETAKQKTLDKINDLSSNNNKSKPSQEEVNQIFNDYFCEEFNKISAFYSGYEFNQKVEDTYSYQIIVESLSGNCTSGEKLALSFKSEGLAKEEAKAINATIFISKVTADTDQGGRFDNNQPAPAESAFDNIESDPVDIKGTGSSKTAVYETSVYFKESVQVRGNRELKILGDAFFSGPFVLNGSSSLAISGDAIFRSEITAKGSAYDICIQGEAFLIKNGKLQTYNIEGNDCSNGDTNNETISVDWNSNTLPIEIKY